MKTDNMKIGRIFYVTSNNIPGHVRQYEETPSYISVSIIPDVMKILTYLHIDHNFLMFFHHYFN